MRWRLPWERKQLNKQQQNDGNIQNPQQRILTTYEDIIYDVEMEENTAATSTSMPTNNSKHNTNLKIDKNRKKIRLAAETEQSESSRAHFPYDLKIIIDIIQYNIRRLENNRNDIEGNT